MNFAKMFYQGCFVRVVSKFLKEVSSVFEGSFNAVMSHECSSSFSRVL